MDSRLIFRHRLSGAKRGRDGVGQPAIGCAGAKRVGVEAHRKIRVLSRGVIAWRKPEVVEPCLQEKPRSVETRVSVPQSDTGGRVEYTKANGKTLVKELGKLAP
jgi:hypothetical protein